MIVLEFEIVNRFKIVIQPIFIILEITFTLIQSIFTIFAMYFSNK